MALGFICGPMVDATKAIGRMGNSKELENLFKVMNRKLEFGKMEKELNG